MKLFSKKNLMPVILLLIIIFIWTLILTNFKLYHIHIYINSNPSDSGRELVKTCLSLETNFECKGHKTISGAYTKAITYSNFEKLSESNWEVVSND